MGDILKRRQKTIITISSIQKLAFKQSLFTVHHFKALLFLHGLVIIKKVNIHKLRGEDTVQRRPPPLTKSTIKRNCFQTSKLEMQAYVNIFAQPLSTQWYPYQAFCTIIKHRFISRQRNALLSTDWCFMQSNNATNSQCGSQWHTFHTPFMYQNMTLPPFSFVLCQRPSH